MIDGCWASKLNMGRIGRRRRESDQRGAGKPLRLIFLEGIILGVSVNSSFMSIEVLVNTSVSPSRTCIKSVHWAHYMYRVPLLWIKFLLAALSLTQTVYFHSLCLPNCCYHLVEPIVSVYKLLHPILQEEQIDQAKFTQPNVGEIEQAETEQTGLTKESSKPTTRNKLSPWKER